MNFGYYDRSVHQQCLFALQFIQISPTNLHQFNKEKLSKKKIANKKIKVYLK